MYRSLLVSLGVLLFLATNDLEALGRDYSHQISARNQLAARLDSIPSGPSANLTVGTVGIGLGDTERTTGLRLNWRNGRLQRANGVNFTLWTPHGVSIGNENDLVDDDGEFGGDAFVGTTNGVALGLLHLPRRVRGVGIGAFGPVAGTLEGVAVSGIVVATVQDLNGVAVGAGGAAAGGNVNGIVVGGLAAGAGEAGDRDEANSFEGGNVNGIAVGGLGAVGQNIRGMGVSAGMVRVREGGVLQGLAASAYNNIDGQQEGLTIGIYNEAQALEGVQIGLINVAQDNPGWARILPILNVGV